MKKIFLLLAMLGLCACGNEIDLPQDAIVGRYEVQTIEVFGCDDASENLGIQDVSKSCTDNDIYYICRSTVLEFNRDNDFIISRETFSVDYIGISNQEAEEEIGYYQISEDTFRVCFEGKCNEAQFEREGSHFTLRVFLEDGCIKEYKAIKIQ